MKIPITAVFFWTASVTSSVGASDAGPSLRTAVGDERTARLRRGGGNAADRSTVAHRERRRTMNLEFGRGRGRGGEGENQTQDDALDLREEDLFHVQRFMQEQSLSMSMPTTTSRPTPAPVETPPPTSQPTPAPVETSPPTSRPTPAPVETSQPTPARVETSGPGPTPAPVETSQPTPAPVETSPPTTQPTPAPMETSGPTPAETFPPTSGPTPAPVETSGPTPAPMETSPPTTQPTPAPVETSGPTPAPVETSPPTTQPTPAPVETSGPTPAPVETSPPTTQPSPEPVETSGPTPAPVETSPPTTRPTLAPVETSESTPAPVETSLPTTRPTPAPVETSGPTLAPVETPAPTSSPDPDTGTVETCTLEVDISCSAELPAGESVDCDFLSTLSPSDLQTGATSYDSVSNCEATIRYGYTARNVGSAVAVVTSLERTRDGSTQELEMMIPPGNEELTSGSDVTVTEMISVNLCDAAASIGASIDAKADTLAGGGSNCAGSDSVAVVLACGVSIDVGCSVAGTDTPCTNLQQQGGNCNVELDYTYTVTNTGSVLESDVTLSREFEGDLLDLSSSLPNELQPGQAATVTDRVTFDACDTTTGNPRLVADVYAISPANRVCSADAQLPDEDDDSDDAGATITGGPACALEAEMTCSALLPAGERVDCDALATLSPSDLQTGAGSYDSVSTCSATLEYTYTVKNAGSSAGDLQSLVRWNLVVGATGDDSSPSSKDLLGVTPPGDIAAGGVVAVSESTTVDLCKAESFASSLIVAANTADGGGGETCDAMASSEVVLGCGVSLSVKCAIAGATADDERECTRENLQKRQEIEGCDVGLEYEYKVKNRGKVALESGGVTLSRFYMRQTADLSSSIIDAIQPGKRTKVTEQVTFDVCESETGEPENIVDVYAVSPASRVCSDEVFLGGV